MKKLATFIIILLPCFAFGQLLFPKVPDFIGNIEKVVEKRYGKEVTYFLFLKTKYRPTAYSGWEYTYLFDEKSNLKNRTNTFQKELKADFLYQKDTIGNRIMEREIVADSITGHKGDYIENEIFLDSRGRIEKVNFWYFNSKESTRELFQIDQNAEYNDNKLLAFTRNQINQNGDTTSKEICSLFYDSSGKLIRTERKDILSGFKTAIQYFYNDKGLINYYSVDFLMELQEYGRKDEIQNITYKYDDYGNWIRMYWKSGTKSKMEARRTITYR